MLSEEELERMIGGGESDRVEFTRSGADMDKARKAVCAFANDLPGHRQPGVLFTGIDDNGRCAGLTVDDALLQQLGGLRSDGNILPFPVMTVHRKVLNGCEVAVVQVEPSDNPPVRVDGRCWVRSGPRRALATPDEERRLTEKRRWGSLSYDMRGVPNALVENDLDMQKFEHEYLPSVVSPEALSENHRSREHQLQALRLATPGGMPTVTAILMLGKDPGYWFPGAYIQFVRYAGNEVTDPIQNHKEIHGTLPDQLRELDAILKANIATALDTRGEKHVERPDYPYEALREIVRNGVIHRNYENSHTPVRIQWFADKVEIISPGSVYDTVTRDNFGQSGATAYRNPTIAEAMKNMGFMQRFGIGIATARGSLADNHNPPLEFVVEETLILATIGKAG